MGRPARDVRDHAGDVDAPADACRLVLLFWFESSDPEKAFAENATGTDEFTVWHRAQLKETTGLDLTQPMEGPEPELILDWSK
jgi:hypothetical protein